MTDLERQQLEEEFNRKYAGKIKRFEEKSFLLQKKMEMRRIKKELRKGVGLTTTKLLCFYIFVIFNVVLAQALIAMWHFADLSYLGVIISDILGQVVVYAIYSIRAYKDTKSEENIRLERDKLEGLPTKAQEKLNTVIDKLEEMGISFSENQQDDNEEDFGTIYDDSVETESSESENEDI